MLKKRRTPHTVTASELASESGLFGSRLTPGYHSHVAQHFRMSANDGLGLGLSLVLVLVLVLEPVFPGHPNSVSACV